MTILPDGRIGSGGHDDIAVKIWHATVGNCVDVISQETTSFMGAVASLPDGRVVAAADEKLKIWADQDRESEKATAKEVARKRACCDVVSVISKFL